jgi:hypothetical protein
MSQSLQTIPAGREVAAADWAVMKEQAGMLVGTGFLPASIKNVEQAVAIIMTGRELNIPAMAALSNINVIQGKPTISPQLMLALINRSGQLENLEIVTGVEGAIVTMKRRGRSPYVARFGPAEAKAMGLDGKDNYKKQAGTMYQWRAVAMAARSIFPDVILGLYTPEEVGAQVAISDTGEQIVEDTETANYVDAEILEPPTEKQTLTRTILELFSELNAKGFDPKWTPKLMANYIESKYLGRTALEELNVAQLRELSLDLGVKLDALVAENDAEKSLAGQGAKKAITRAASTQEGSARR